MLTIQPNDGYEKYLFERAYDTHTPISGTFELLPTCNMDCRMCYIRISPEEMRRQGRMLSAGEWLRIGRQAGEAGALFILLTGGEPLLHPEFREIYKGLRALGMCVTVNTNGTLIDEEWAEFFGRHKPRRINITLYGADDSAYEKLCHYPGGFSKTIRAIRLLRQYGVDVKINGSVTKYNHKDMEAIYRIGRELEIPVHMDTYMLPGIRERGLPFQQQARLMPEDAAAAEIYTRKMEMEPEAFLRYMHRILMQTEQKNVTYGDKLACLAGNYSFAIGWRGEMRPCVTFEKPAVSVFEKGFEAAWQEVSQKAGEIQVSKTCVTCPLRPACKTCPAAAWLETGKYDGVPEYLCRYAKEQVRLMREEARESQGEDAAPG